jgi:antitoxin component YwqK of YwqJK toxin-antitoxin module
VRTFLLLILCLPLGLGVFWQGNNFPENPPEQGFTNKAEAKNQMVNGVKEGKWIEYIHHNSTMDSNHLPSYRLVVYKAGKPDGVVREYYKNGTLYSEKPYADGVYNGIFRLYNENKKLKMEISYVNGALNGVAKEFYDNGKLQSETTYTDNNADMTRTFDEDGNEIK